MAAVVVLDRPLVQRVVAVVAAVRLVPVDLAVVVAAVPDHLADLNHLVVVAAAVAVVAAVVAVAIVLGL